MNDDKAPACEHWMLGDIQVAERPNEDPTMYKRAILVTFKTVEEYRQALRFMSPILEQSR